MNSKKIGLILALFVGVALVIVGVIFTPKKNKERAGMESFVQITDWTTASQVTVSTTPIMLVATNTARSYLEIRNASGTYAYLNPSTSSTNAQGYAIYLSANGGSYTFDDRNPYVGPVYASSTVASTILTVLEK